MEEMKFVENPKVNKKVVEIVETLKEEIIFYFHPNSIIVWGSFGRGEATVINEDGKLKFLSDCEIVIIPYKYIFNRRKINAFESNFYKRTGLKVEIWGAALSFYLLIPFMKKKMKPTMANYDLKYGSKVIYGKNYLERIPDFKPKDILPWEGIRLLFNRMAEASEYFSVENPSEEMIFWTDKIVLACQDALLLSKGRYHHLYKERNNMFNELFPDQFNDFEDIKQKFSKLAKEATERKLNGKANVSEPVEFWFDVIEICDKTFRYVIKEEMQIEFDDYLEFQKKYVNHPKLRDFSRLPSGNSVSQNFWSALKRLIVYKEVPSPRLIRNFTIHWAHMIYSTVPLIYFGLSREKEINEKYLNQAMNIISLFGGESVNCSDSLEYREYAKKEVLKYWRQFRSL